MIFVFCFSHLFHLSSSLLGDLCWGHYANCLPAVLHDSKVLHIFDRTPRGAYFTCASILLRVRNALRFSGTSSWSRLDVTMGRTVRATRIEERLAPQCRRPLEEVSACVRIRAIKRGEGSACAHGEPPNHEK